MGYDAIIIGSGLGGCGAAAALTAAGKKVLILERLDVIGGRCSTKQREGFRMDVGCHFLWGCEHGAFEQAAAMVGKGGAIEWNHLKKIAINIQDIVMILGDGKLKITGGKGDDITIEAASVFRKMRNSIPQWLRTTGFYMFSKMIPIASAMVQPLLKKLEEVSVESVMYQSLNWPKLLDVIEFFQFGAWGTPSDLTAVSEIIRTMFGFLEYCKPGVKGHELFGYPTGGLGAIPETICRGIVEMGGEVRLGAGVKKIIVESGRAAGVEMDDGEVIKAPIVISNAGVKETVADLVGEEHFDSEYAEKIRDLLVGISCFVIRAALDTKVTDMEGLCCVPQAGLKDYSKAVWHDLVIPPGPPALMWNVPSNMDPTAAPEGKQVVSFVGPLRWGCKDPWNKVEKDAFDAIEVAIPGFKEHLMWYDFLTPDTYAALGEVGSPAIGIAQCIGQVGDKRPSVVSPIEGLYYVGAEVGRNMSGVGTDMAIRIGLACGNYIVRNTDHAGSRKLMEKAACCIGKAPGFKWIGAAARTP